VLGKLEKISPKKGSFCYRLLTLMPFQTSYFLSYIEHKNTISDKFSGHFFDAMFFFLE